MMNSPQVRANAAAFAALLRPLPEPVMAAYERALGRAPTEVERVAAQAFITKRRAADGLDAALTDFCQTLFAGNEFIYVR